MSRKITLKTVQVHCECVCGLNIVCQNYLSITWKELSKEGIIRRKDKKTGEYFLFTKIENNECHCNDNGDDDFYDDY